MSDYNISIAEFLQKSSAIPVIDVRSPAEFEQGHIPSSCSMPLFSNEERSVVGTLYLKKGSKEAMMQGLEFIGPKMKRYAALASEIAPGGEALLYCWRGGMRSQSMAWLLNTAGIKTQTLEGGYKSFRRYVRNFFARPANLVVIGGLTGSGKSAVLEMLELMGKQIIHLERLAHHKGSVFGSAGMPPQPTTEQFENEIFDIVRRLNPAEVSYIEDESLTIGSVFIPRPFYEQMCASRSYHLIVPLEIRVNRLVAEYASCDRDWLVAGVRRISKRLGLEQASRVIDCIFRGEMSTAVEMVLQYYDKVYARSMGLNPRRTIREIRVDPPDISMMAEEILKQSQPS